MNTSSHHLNDNETTPVLIGEGFAKPAAQASPEATRWLALGAIVGPVLFTLAWVVLGFLSPGYTAWGIRIAPYSPISQPISGLGLGPLSSIGFLEQLLVRPLEKPKENISCVCSSIGLLGRSI